MAVNARVTKLGRSVLIEQPKEDARVTKLGRQVLLAFTDTVNARVTKLGRSTLLLDLRPSKPSITAPANAAELTGGSQSVQWTASTDPVGGSITYSARYQLDGGAWVDVFSGESGLSYLWDISGLASGSYTLELWAVNVGGTGNESFRDRVAFTVDHEPTQPTITAPANGATLDSFEATISYTGSTNPTGGDVAYTAEYRPAAGGSWVTIFEDRDGTDDYTWSIFDIAAGDYTVRLYATGVDTGEDSTADSITVTLDPAEDPLKPPISVGSVTETELTVSTVPVPEILSVTYYIETSGGSPVDSTTKTGSGRFEHEFTGLTAGTDYVVYLEVEYAERTVASDEVDVTTLAAPLGATLGCPPVPQAYAWNPDSNPGDYATWRGIGWYTPFPGEPLRGIVTCKLRYPTDREWDVEISDDGGATYTSLTTITAETGSDGDGLSVHQFDLDTTGYSDGQDYRLRATSDALVIESLTFLIDNAGDAHGWHIRDNDPATDRFAVRWGTEGAGPYYNSDGAQLWYRHADSGAILGYLGSPWSAYTDLECPESYGADATVRFWLWSGEGGYFQAQGGFDLEGWRCGIGFFVNGQDAAEDIDSFGDGIGTNATGIYVGLGTDVTQYYGCCDDYYTSSVARLQILGRASTGETFGPMTPDTGPGGLPTIQRWYGKSYHRVPRFISNKLEFASNPMRARLGGTPGDGIEEKYTCGRLYNMYTVRARAEIDPVDASRVRVRARLDGPGVLEPASGYWHHDQWYDDGVDWTAGGNAIVGRHFAVSFYGPFGGSRLYTSWSVLPLEPQDLPTDEPDVPPTTTLPVGGEPCTLILEVYDTDRTSIVWEVGTDRDHPNPYLMLPDNYGEQELDIIDGSASIGQVEVAVIDKARTAGDQDSGWLTLRMSEDGINAIHGRRCRLIRYVDWDIPPVVIADGPAGVPRMDSSYAAYRWTIRDTRETERRKTAFTSGVPNEDTWILPQGNPRGWGKEALTEGGAVYDYIIPATDPLTGTYTVEDFDFPLAPDKYERGVVDLNSYTPGSDIDEAVVVTDFIRDKLIATPEFVTFAAPLSYAGEWVKWTWEDIEILWRYPGDSDDEWRVSTPVEYMPQTTYTFVQALSPGYGLSLIEYIQGDGYTVQGTTIEPPGFADRLTIRNNTGPIGGVDGDWPTDGQTIEFAVRYVGDPSEELPRFIELDPDDVPTIAQPMTAGEFLKDLYDGVYSPRDPLTGAIVPTGIIYNEDDLLQLTDPVRLVLTEPIKDVRDWAERYIYSVTGWTPALDNLLEISPVSQVPPDDFTTTATRIDDDVTEPSSDWNAGETVVNILTINYERWYQRVDDEAYDSYAHLGKRDITLQVRDEDSISLHSEQEVTLDGRAFIAFGLIAENGSAQPLRGDIEEELAWQLWDLKREYVFDRYRYGAQVIRAAVKRSRTYELRAGDWVIVDLSWLPDYVLRRRGSVFGGQVIAIADLDCAWRMLTIEEALPVELTDDS